MLVLNHHNFHLPGLKDRIRYLGVEMASTGEVGCLGEDFDEAFLKSLISIGFKIPEKTILMSTGNLENKLAFLHETRQFWHNWDLNCMQRPVPAKFMKENGIKAELLNWPLEKKEPNVVTYISEGKIDLVINIPKNAETTELNKRIFDPPNSSRS